MTLRVDSPVIGVVLVATPHLSCPVHGSAESDSRSANG
jgi:hypothetical protein